MITLYDEFKTFVNSILNKKYKEELYDYINNYTTFMISRKNNIDNIKNNRMKLFIDYYYDNKKEQHLSKKELEDFYKKNINDDLKPLIDFKSIKNKNNDDEEEKRDEDVELHYKEYFTRHIYHYKDEITECETCSYIDEKSDSYSYKSYDEYDDDYYNDDNDDYYNDDDDYNDDYR